MLIFQTKMLWNDILETHFLTNLLLEPKWKHPAAAPECFWQDFERPRCHQNSQKSIKMGIKKFDVFLECLMEGSLEGFGSQIKAKTIQNDTKNGSKRDKSRPPKTHRFYNEKLEEKKKEIRSSNKNVENVEAWKSCFFIGLYSIICTCAFCTPCRNWSLHGRGEA